MARPARIAAVVAATAVLMTTAGFGVSAIQRAIATGPAAPIVSADGPALLGGTAQDLAAASAVLGPISDTRLPSIKKILASAAPATPATATRPASQGADSAPASTGESENEHDSHREHEEHDD